MTEALKGGAAALVLVATAACGGTAADKPAAAVTQIELPEISVTDAELQGNPLRAEWTGPYGVPPFAEIKTEHFKPAILKGILEARAEVQAIIDNPEKPTFENTILAYERTGQSLAKVMGVFGNLSSTDTNPEIQALEAEIYPMLSTERDAVTFNPKMFA
ncbi:MAG: M3 family peptidase, partial [Hyphomonas sp.]|nr:M3 family peptidase [Hyphomonas sp.]